MSKLLIPHILILLLASCNRQIDVNKISNELKTKFKQESSLDTSDIIFENFTFLTVDTVTQKKNIPVNTSIHLEGQS